MSKFSAQARRIEAAVRFAQVFDGDAATGSHRQEVFCEAKAQGISTFDALRTHILLRIANGSTQLVSQWLRPGEPENSSGE